MDLKLVFDVQEELHDGHWGEASFEEVALRGEWFGRIEDFLLNDLAWFEFHGFGESAGKAAAGLVAQLIAGGGEAVGKKPGKRCDGGDFDDLLAFGGGEVTPQAVEFVGGCVVGHADDVGDGFPSHRRLAAFLMADAMDEDGVDGGVVDEVLVGNLGSDSAVEISLAAEFLNGE